MEDLIAVLRSLPYKGDDSGIGCSNMGGNEKYRGILRDLEFNGEEYGRIIVDTSGMLP
jgi:hypothetical protein